MRNYSLALDVGATKIAVGIVADDGEVIGRIDVSSKSETREELNENLSTAIRQQISTIDSKIVGVGIGSAGPIDPVLGTINPVNISLWTDFPLVKLVSEVSSCANVTLVGDASALTYAEFILGAGKKFKNILGLVVSTGIGGGAVLNGNFYPGGTGNASYIGHAVYDPNGNFCACGTQGCVEAYSSGPSMARWAAANGLALIDHDNFVEVAEYARQSNPVALTAIQQGVKALATTLVNAVAVLDLDAIVVGGGVTNAADVYWPVLEKEFKRQVKRLGFPKECQILQASLGNHSGLVGAGLVGHINSQKKERN